MPVKEILSELADLDGFSFNGISSSAYIRSAMHKDGYNMPEKHSGISKMVQS